MTSGVRHIALTGIIGSGKSLVADLFRKSGFMVLDVDQIASQLMEKGESGWLRIREEFGAAYFNDDETLDRPKLRKDIFENAELRGRIDSLIHPLIRREMFRLLDDQHKGAFTIIEVPLLFEVGWQDDFDLAIVVSADEKTCLARLMARDGLDERAGREALATQMGLAQKIELADMHIDNNGTREETERQVREIIEKLRNGSA